jgi:hypothetical protein
MGKDIGNKFKVGDWIKPNKDRHAMGSTPNYINITQKNENIFNGLLEGSYFLVQGDEIKKAENYLKALIDVKVGDYISVGTFINKPYWEIDKITEVPEVENPLEVQSYGLKSVKTERGESLWYQKVPGAKISVEEAREYFVQQKLAHSNAVSVFERQLNELSIKK